jgi:hypothetical protein
MCTQSWDLFARMYQDIARRLVGTSTTESSRSGDVGIRERRRLLRLHRTRQYLAWKSKPTRAAYRPGRPSNRHTYCCRSLGCRARCSPIGTSLCSSLVGRRAGCLLTFLCCTVERLCRAAAAPERCPRARPQSAAKPSWASWLAPWGDRPELDSRAYRKSKRCSMRGSTRAGLWSLLQVETDGNRTEHDSALAGRHNSASRTKT